MLDTLIDRVRGALTPDTESDLRAQIAAADARIAELSESQNRPAALGPALQQRSDLDAKLNNVLHAKRVADAAAAERDRRNGADKNLKAALKTASTMQTALGKAQAGAGAAHAAVANAAGAVADAEDAHVRAIQSGADALLTPDAADDGAAAQRATDAMGRLQSARDVQVIVGQRAEQADAAVHAAAAALADAQRAARHAVLDVAEQRLHAARAAFAPHVALWFASSRQAGVIPAEITFGEDLEHVEAAQAELRAMLGEG